MIQSKSDLSFYISEDNKQYFENRGILKRLGGVVKDAILLNEKFLIYRFKVELRKVEYYKNVTLNGVHVVVLINYSLGLILINICATS